jgi:hypothetical protein
MQICPGELTERESVKITRQGSIIGVKCIVIIITVTQCCLSMMQMSNRVFNHAISEQIQFCPTHQMKKNTIHVNQLEKWYKAGFGLHLNLECL